MNGAGVLQVDTLEAAVRAAKAADHSIEVQAAESRARSLQASLSRKEDTIRELRERMDQACRWGHPPPPFLLTVLPPAAVHPSPNYPFDNPTLPPAPPTLQHSQSIPHYPKPLATPPAVPVLHTHCQIHQSTTAGRWYVWYSFSAGCWQCHSYRLHDSQTRSIHPDLMLTACQNFLCAGQSRSV